MGPSVIVGRQGTPYKEISCACSPVKGATMHVAPGCPGPTPVQAQSTSVATTSLPANCSLSRGPARVKRGSAAAPCPFSCLHGAAKRPRDSCDKCCYHRNIPPGGELSWVK